LFSDPLETHREFHESNNLVDFLTTIPLLPPHTQNMAGPIQIPPGGTWFDTLKRSFADVPIDPNDQGIATSEFLEAAEATTTLFGEQ